jgi:hypothetical protein
MSPERFVKGESERTLYEGFREPLVMVLCERERSCKPLVAFELVLGWISKLESFVNNLPTEL